MLKYRVYMYYYFHFLFNKPNRIPVTQLTARNVDKLKL